MRILPPRTYFLPRKRMLLPNMDRISEVVSVQGNIGAGKTTFMKVMNKALCLRPGVVFIDEPVVDWQVKRFKDGTESILSCFYSDVPKYAFSFQVNAFCTRQSANVAAAAGMSSDVPQAVFVTERSMTSDNLIFRKALFESGQISEAENYVYLQFAALVAGTMNKKEKVMIYLDVDYTLCYDRLRRRARGEEVGVTLEYLKLLQEKHEEMLAEFDGLVVRVKWVDTEEGSDERTALCKSAINEVPSLAL